MKQYTKKSPNKESLVIKALRQATPAQLLKIRSLIEIQNKSARGFFIFYAGKALQDFDRKRFSSIEVLRGIDMVGNEVVADILQK